MNTTTIYENLERLFYPFPRCPYREELHNNIKKSIFPTKIFYLYTQKNKTFSTVIFIENKQIRKDDKKYYKMMMFFGITCVGYLSCCIDTKLCYEKASQLWTQEQCEQAIELNVNKFKCWKKLKSLSP